MIRMGELEKERFGVYTHAAYSQVYNNVYGDHVPVENEMTGLEPSHSDRSCIPDYF